MSAAIPNEMILASAGSGKTWQLTNRFIALMGQQLLAGKEVTPERIVAVTFTRKAAGEFFDSILKKLAEGASSADPAREMANVEAMDPEAKSDPLRPILSQLTQADYRQLLRVFITRMPRLFLGTLDSFFSSILRCFPAEFGLAGDFEILSEHLGAVERERVYRTAFQRALPSLRSRAESITSQQEFLEAFRRATFGKEESSIRSVLDQFVENQHEILLHAAREELWGNPNAIWTNGCRWIGAKIDLKAEVERLFEVFRVEGIPDAAWEFWEEFQRESEEFVPGVTLPQRTKFFLDKLLPVWADLEAGQSEITVNRAKQTLGPEACDCINRIFTFIVGEEIRVRLERTRGVWAVLDLFEAGWSRHVRRRGKLTFQDMELILAGHEFAENLSCPMLSQVPGDDDRLRIDYRLDARYDHWLLDEFQDTNYVQWSVIRNLIDEAVQDNSDERTIFQVGDVKQAIYAWRGGDTRLFDDILARYNAGEEKRIVVRPLNVSWRSGHDVIEMVNKVFGTAPALQALEVPEATVKRWQWGTHTVAGINDSLPGYAALYNPIPVKGEKVALEDRFAVVVGLLEKIQPVARGLSCAILVQSNDAGRAMVDYIRAHSPSRIPVMSESEIAIATDNPLTLTLLSLLKCAAHPGDTLAWGHLRMTPFLAVLPATRSALAEQVLRMVFDEGFETTLRHWLDLLLATGITLNAFSLSRAEELSLAARQFDQTGSRDIDEFLAYAEHYTVREPDTRRAVQVMTVHKSKGLTFDCVLLPDLEGDSITTVRPGIAVKRDDQRQVQWVFDLPYSEIVKADETLAEYREEREAEAAYEELCKFYVALTRARCANYLITAPRAGSSQSKNFVKLLQRTLTHDKALREVPLGTVTAELLYESNTSATDEEWFKRRPITQSHAEAPAAEPAPEAKLPSSGRVRPTRRTPSGSETSVVTAKQLFSRGGRFARAYGTLVHALYEQIEWFNETPAESLSKLWAAVPTLDESIRQRAEEEVRQSLGVAAIAEILSRPSPDALCWREKRFEILLNNEWLSGTFDRVVIEPHRALILDFKTDKVATADALRDRINGYRPQLAVYRQVLHRMTGLPTSAIDCRLLFTHRRQLVSV